MAKRGRPLGSYTLSEQQMAEIEAEYRMGRSARDIAARYGVGRSTVLLTLERRGVPRRTRTARQGVRHVDTARIVQLRAEGKNWYEIGKAVGLSHEGARQRWLAAQATDDTDVVHPLGCAT